MGSLSDITHKLGGSEGKDGGVASLQNLFSNSGGLEGITSKLTNSGLGKQVQSWIGTGDNKPVSGQQIQQAMGPGQVHQVAQQAGISDEEASEHIAQAVPEMVNKATPQGQIPPQDPFSKGLDSVKKLLKI